MLRLDPRRLARPPRSSQHVADDDWTVERWDLMLRVRFIGIAMLAVSGALAFDWRLGPIIAIGVAGYNAAHLWYLRALGRPARWLPISDVLACVLVIFVVPDVLLGATFVMITIVAAATVAGAGVAALTATLVGTVGLLVVGAVEAADGARSAAMGVAVSGVLLVLGIGSLVDSEARLRARLTGLVEDLDAVLWTRNPSTHCITNVNGRVAGLLGLSAQEWMAEGFWPARIHPDDHDDVLARTLDAVAAGRDHDLTYRMVDSGGRTVHVLDRVTVIRDATGVVTELHGVTLDVSERHSIEVQSRQYADIVEHIDLALVVTTVSDTDAVGGDEATLVVLVANPAAGDLLGVSAEAATGRSLCDLFPAVGSRAVVRRLLDVAQSGRPLAIDDLPVASGPAKRTATLRAFRLPGGLVAVSLLDTTDIVVATRALRRQALHDALTDLPNRAQLEDHLQGEVLASTGSERCVALLLMDLDQFKEVNDALGHSMGDRLLVAVSNRLRALMAPSFVARLGGDEFAIVMSGVDVDEAAARAAAEQVAVALSAPFTIDDLRLQTNVSIGIALVPDHAADTDELVRRADVAMYVAKRAGKGYVVYRADEDRSSVARLRLIGDLGQAVPAGQLVLHYQPMLDLRRGTVARIEALVRWEHPVHGLLMPDEFIGLAALSGVCRPIAHWVLGEATGAAAAWRAAGHDVGVAVNLSVRNLFDHDLIAAVERALEASGLPADQLTIELTESELMDDPSVALTQFRALQGLGVATSIDDFGTGYSSFTYLRDLPLREIKIDKSFTAGMHRRGGAYTIVRSMIELGHNLGLEVVAEGVERADDLTTLTRLGCDRAQGFHIARPMDALALRRWLDATHAAAPLAATVGLAASPSSRA